MHRSTPGPWMAEITKTGRPGWRTYDYFRGAVSHGVGRQYELLAAVREYGDERTNARMAADTRLMAAAPELLAVAQFLLSIERELRQHLCQCDDVYCVYCAWLNDAQAAVDKALGTTEGGQP